MIKSNIEKYILLTLRIFKENDVWVVECDELGTANFGKTFEEAREAILESVELHLNSLEDVGECERFLKENNIAVYTHIPTHKKKSIPVEPDVFVTTSVTPLPLAFC